MSKDLGGGTISSVVRDLWQKITKIDTEKYKNHIGHTKIEKRVFI